jgi:hypothetical protein
MSTIVSGNGSLQEDTPRFNAAVRIPAHFISWLFHPLFIPLYVTWFLLYIHPSAFVALNEKVKFFKLIFVFANTALFPGLAVFLMWRLKFIQSIYLRTQKERIIPYAAAMVFYFWAWYVSRSLKDNHVLFMDFLFASFLTVVAAWLANIYFKISMHALAIGGMAFFILRASFEGDGTSALYPSVALLIAGLVCSARMVVSDHKAAEIYLGILVGILCQVLAIIL